MNLSAMTNRKIARFKNLKYFCRVSQNGLAFLRRTGKASLSELPEIYGGINIFLYFCIIECSSSFFHDAMIETHDQGQFLLS